MSPRHRPTDFKMTGIPALEQLETTPLSDRHLPASTYALLQESASVYGDKVALRFLTLGTADEDAVSYSYQQLLGHINQTANALHALGIGEHDAVAMLLPNLPQTHFTLWGAEAVGILTPINPLLEIEHIAAILNEIACPLLVTLAPVPGSDLWQKAQQLSALVPSLKTVIAVDPSVFLPDAMRTALEAQRPDYLQPIARAEGESVQVFDFDRLTASYNDQELDSYRLIPEDDIASYFHTGGTTGTPKLAPHRHRHEVASAFQISTTLDVQTHHVTLVGLPLFHVNAVLTCLSAWMSGAEILLATAQGYRTPAVLENFWALVEKYRVTGFSAVPTILSGLLNFPTAGYDLSSLQWGLCGAAPLATELANRFEQQTGLKLLEGYGQTEGTCATTISPLYGPSRIGSVGCRQPYMGLRIVEIDEKTGRALRDCDVNEPGVVAISGPNVFDGYKQSQHNIGQWVDDGWFNTGDLGRLDQDGYLWLTGRSKDVIIRGGHNIDPQVIEEAYFKHDAVADVAAIGKPDVRVGELPIAYIQLKPGQQASIEELLQFGQDEIHERAAVPKEIHIVENLPLTAVGKIFKPELRNLTVEHLVRDELARLGVSAYQLQVNIDKQYGQSVLIELEDKSQANKVNEVLGLYAFKTTCR